MYHDAGRNAEREGVAGFVGSLHGRVVGEARLRAAHGELRLVEEREPLVAAQRDVLAPDRGHRVVVPQRVVVVGLVKKGMAHGVQIAGAEVTKLLKYLKYTGAVSSSVKDPIWKYRWVEAHEPENFKKIYKWLDIKEYLILRASGEFVMTQDSAFGTLLYDTRKGHEGWCKPVCDMVGVKMEHLAPIKKSTEKVGEVTESAAKELGLAPGTAVYGGGGDASLIGVGAGATEVGDTHIYSGTSGWVGTVVEKQTVDTGAMIAAIVGADPDTFNYFAELETSNKWRRLG